MNIPIAKTIKQARIIFLNASSEFVQCEVGEERRMVDSQAMAKEFFEEFTTVKK